MLSPIIEWVLKIFLGAFSTNPVWENYVVVYFCWFLILISLRLTVFLPEQRPKCKLITMAFILLCLSINIETGLMGKPGQISCTMNFTNKFIKNNFSTRIPWENSKSISLEGYAPANAQITTNISPNAGFKISGRVIIKLIQQN